MAAHLTAIHRNKPSAPAQWLAQRGMLRGKLLDYGCGQGRDAESFGMVAYDPHYAPDMPVGTFDTIACTYVLNVIPDASERDDVLATLNRYLAPGGTAYISVRNDRANLNGWTKRGTWQGFIELDLPVVTTNSSFTIYRLEG